MAQRQFRREEKVSRDEYKYETATFSSWRKNAMISPTLFRAPVFLLPVVFTLVIAWLIYDRMQLIYCPALFTKQKATIKKKKRDWFSEFSCSYFRYFFQGQFSDIIYDDPLINQLVNNQSTHWPTDYSAEQLVGRWLKNKQTNRPHVCKCLLVQFLFNTKS